MIPVLLALSAVPLSPEVVTWTEVVELNHVHNEDLSIRFVQLMGWNDDGSGQLMVDWWRLWRKPEQVPTPRRVGNRFHITFCDPKDGTLRRIVARSCWISHTEHDREIEDRVGGPQRRELPGRGR